MPEDLDSDFHTELMTFYLRLTKRLDKVADAVLTPGGKLNHAWHHPAGPKVMYPRVPRYILSSDQEPLFSVQILSGRLILVHQSVSKHIFRLFSFGLHFGSGLW